MLQSKFKIKVGVIGAAGYTGGELLRLLLNHPDVNLVFAHSRSHAGKAIADIHTDLLGDTDLQFAGDIVQEVDLIYLCVAHGESRKIVSQIADQIKVIDLSSDFRIQSDARRSFVYGLPELNREEIRIAKNIANPGCFATAIQLALLPLAEKKLLRSDITISCTTGSTGAGQALSERSHFSWRQNNLSVYKPFTHQHLEEMTKSLTQLDADFKQTLVMIPQRGAFTRGIFVHLTFAFNDKVANPVSIFKSYYEHHPFVHVSESPVDLKQVVNTNKCILYLEQHNNQLMVVSILDNLLKGASGQAVQNMNLMFGLKETCGLKLKASAF